MKKLIGLVLVMLLLGAHGICESAFPNVQAIRDFSEGMAAFQDANGNWGYMDASGNVVITPEWNLADCFTEGIARVGTSDHLYGYIDATGAVIFRRSALRRPIFTMVWRRFA